MKMHGQTIQVPVVEYIVIPRKTGNLVFMTRPVIDWEPHAKLDPKPVAPVIQRPNQPPQENVEDPKYKKKYADWHTRRWDWMILKSLEATEGLEFETVTMSDPKTWGKWRKEMEKAGLVPSEVDRIEATVLLACRLDQSKIDIATNSFLAEMARTQNQESSPNTDSNATPSGTLASASA